MNLLISLRDAQNRKRRFAKNELNQEQQSAHSCVSLNRQWMQIVAKLNIVFPQTTLLWHERHR